MKESRGMMWLNSGELSRLDITQGYWHLVVQEAAGESQLYMDSFQHVNDNDAHL